jgi:DnaJ-class molecular chaperone
MTTKPCPECEGQGQREFERVCRASASNPYGDIEGYMAECDNCHGLGEIEYDEEDEE